MGISISGDKLYIDGFSTDRRDITLYFADIPEDDRERKLEMLLQLGILAQNSAGTTFSTTYVETAFERLKEKMNHNIEQMLGPQGEFTRSLEKSLGERVDNIPGVLDPNEEGTPLYKLRGAILEEISKIKDAISKEEGRKEEARKGTQKGMRFEEVCIGHICDIAEPYSDMVESTGETTGDLSTSKKGDAVVTIAGTEKRFVLEMKHHANLNLPEIRRELNEAMTNRRADYSILVSRNRDALPREVGWFNEYDENKLVCAVSDTDDDTKNMWVLTTAYRWARFRMTSDTTEQAEADQDVIANGIKEIDASLRRMQTVTTQCKSIHKTTEKIEGVMREEERNIKDKISEILHALK